jgi:hypothetical protein
MSLIALEEHYAWDPASADNVVGTWLQSNNAVAYQRLYDRGPLRLEQMDAAGIDFQIRSLCAIATPGSSMRVMVGDSPLMEPQNRQPPVTTAVSTSSTLPTPPSNGLPRLRTFVPPGVTATSLGELEPIWNLRAKRTWSNGTTAPPP